MSNQANQFMNVSKEDAALYQQLIAVVSKMSPELQGKIMELAKNTIQKGDVNMNQNQQQTQGQEMVTISKEMYEKLVNSAANTQPQAPVTTQSQPVVEPTLLPNNSLRVAQIENELIRLQNYMADHVNAGLTIAPVVQDNYNELLAEYQQLTGIPTTKVGVILDTITTATDRVAQYGQSRIAKDFVPNTINNTSGFLADLISLGGELITGVGEVLIGTIDGVAGVAKTATTLTATTASGVLGVGAKTVAKVGQATAVASENAIHTTFNLIRK